MVATTGESRHHRGEREGRDGAGGLGEQGEGVRGGEGAGAPRGGLHLKPELDRRVARGDGADELGHPHAQGHAAE